MPWQWTHVNMHIYVLLSGASLENILGSSGVKIWSSLLQPQPHQEEESSQKKTHPITPPPRPQEEEECLKYVIT